MNILITGASRGIGKAIALAAANKGHHIGLIGRSVESLQLVEEEIRSQHGVAQSFVCDVTHSNQVGALRENTIAAFDTLDVIINNAGVAPSLKLEDTTDEIWERTFATNVCSAFFMVRTFLPDLRKSSTPHIIAIASTAALEGFAYTAAYTASKHAVLGLSRSLAKELYRSNIAVATICPGFVRTAILDESIRNIMAKTGKSQSEAEAQLGAMNTSGKIIEPNEVAAEVLRMLELPPSENGYEVAL